MPYEEDKLTKGEKFLQDSLHIAQDVEQKKQSGDLPQNPDLFWPCEKCGKKFKMGYDEEKKKEVPQNPDGSRHQKFKYPPKEVDGKKIWDYTCTNSKDDWSKKKDFKKPEYNADFPISSLDLIELIAKHSGLSNKDLQYYIGVGKGNCWTTLARFAGCLNDCEKLGNTKSAFVGMIFKVGEKSE